MPTGGHIIVGQRGNGTPTTNQPGTHFEEGVGWGAFPVSVDIPNTCPSSFHGCYPMIYMDPHNDSMNRIWCGGRNNNVVSPEYLAFYWDGAAWTKYIIPTNLSYNGTLTLSRVPGTEDKIYASQNAGNGNQNQLLYYDGASWSTIRGAGSYTDPYGGVSQFTPYAISESSCVWVANSDYGGNPGYWLDATTQYTGGDLPLTQFAGSCMLGDGSIFILTTDGRVYRAATTAGPFVLDNSTDGPFAGSYYTDTTVHTCMKASADGNTVVIQSQDSDHYWVRNGSDDWDNYTVGLSSTLAEASPAAVNRQILFRGSSSNAIPYISYNGGASWAQLRPGGGGANDIYKGVDTCSFVSDVSNERRLVTVLKQSAQDSSLWWRGDALHSPWAYWTDYNKSPATAGRSPREVFGIQSFESKHLILYGFFNTSNECNALHYDPNTDTWTFYQVLGNESFMYIHGTAYAAGQIHGVINRRFIGELYYARWNGTSYDTSAITGSAANWTGGTQAYHIQANASGSEIWITTPYGNQILYSDDSGSTWSNIYAAAAAVHADAAQAKDIIVVSDTEVYVAFSATVTGTRFSLWNGSAWSVAAPDIALGSGTRCIFVDRAGDLWFLSSNTSTGPNYTYKLVTGSWVLQHTHTFVDGKRDVNGMASMQDDYLITTSFTKPNDAFLLAEGGLVDYSEADLLGWTDHRGFDSIFSDFIDVTDFGPDPATPPPYLQNQDPAPSSTGNSYDTPIYLEVVDDNDDADASTIEIRVDGVLAWTANNPVQPGFSGYFAVVTNGYSYRISSWDVLDPGSHTIQVTGSDLAGNPFDESYSFETDALETLCDFSQWGQYQWGQTQWGSIEQPYVTSVQALNEYTIRVEFNCLEAAVDPEALGGYLNPLSYSISGGYRQLTPLSVSYPATWTVDIKTLEMTDGATYVLTQTALPVTSSHAFTGIGVHPYITDVENPSYGILNVTFSEEMENDRSYSSVSSYTVVPIGNDPVVHVTDVLRVSGTQVQLSFTGGGSPYLLTASGLMDVAGNYIDPNTYRFLIDFPGIDELATGDKIFVETDLGAVQLIVSSLSKRRIEDLAIQRTKNLGHSAQVSLISGALKDSGINRDEQKLKLFKG